jgi:hypothetical protein
VISLIKEFLDIIDDSKLRIIYEDLLVQGESKELLEQAESRMEFLTERTNDKSYVPNYTTYHKSNKQNYPGVGPGNETRAYGSVNSFCSDGTSDSSDIHSDPIVSDIIKSSDLLKSSILPYGDKINKFEYRPTQDEIDLDREAADDIYHGALAVDFVNELDVFETESLDPLENRGRVNNPVSLSDYRWLLGGDGLRGIGVDVAYYGDDRTTQCFREGNHVVDFWSFVKADTVETTGYIVLAIREFKPDFICIDVTGGLGASVFDQLKHYGMQNVCRIEGVHFNEKPLSDRLKAYNRRAEMYLYIQEKFREGTISLPSDKDLIKELAYVRYKIVGDGGSIRIVPKDEIKKELGRSPDKADALVLAFSNRPAFNVYGG